MKTATTITACAPYGRVKQAIFATFKLFPPYFSVKIVTIDFHPCFRLTTQRGGLALLKPFVFWCRVSTLKNKTVVCYLRQFHRSRFRRVFFAVKISKPISKMLNLLGWFVIVYVTKQLELSEECRVDRLLSHSRICFFGQQEQQTQQQTARTTRAAIAPSDENQQRIAPASHRKSPPQQAGRACMPLCVVFRANSFVLKMLIQAPRNESAVLCCRIGFLSERSLHTVHDYGSYRARHG